MGKQLSKLCNYCTCICFFTNGVNIKQKNAPQAQSPPFMGGPYFGRARSSLKANMLSQKLFLLTLLHSEWPKLYGVLAILSAVGLKKEKGKSGRCTHTPLELPQEKTYVQE